MRLKLHSMSRTELQREKPKSHFSWGGGGGPWALLSGSAADLGTQGEHGRRTFRAIRARSDAELGVAIDTRSATARLAAAPPIQIIGSNNFATKPFQTQEDKS
eukprot:6460654-Amphidinium_carterae.1